MDLAAYALLDKPVSDLGLSTTALELLDEVGVHDISTLLDQDWAMYPQTIADEIRQVALARGLIEEATEPVSQLTTQQLAECEWNRIATLDGSRVHISHTDAQMPPDLELLVKSEGYRALEDVWVEHWTSSTDYESDFRPWFELLSKHPPKQLRALEVGTYGGGSAYAKLGPVAPTIAALPGLRSLFLSGDMDGVAPFGSERLESFQVETGRWSPTPMKRFIDWTKLESLKTFIATAELSDTRSLTRLWVLPALHTIELSVFVLHPEFFALAKPTAVRDADVSRCRWPIDDARIIESLVAAAPHLQDTMLTLPTDAQDAARELEAAGLRCAYGD